MKASRFVGIGAMLFVLGGCAANQGGPSEPTHEWVAKNRAAELHFSENNQDCVHAGGGMSAYESCMSARGYTLYDR